MNELVKTVMNMVLVPRVSPPPRPRVRRGPSQNDEVGDDEEQAQDGLSHPVVGLPPGEASQSLRSTHPQTALHLHVPSSRSEAHENLEHLVCQHKGVARVLGEGEEDKKPAAADREKKEDSGQVDGQ